MREVWADNLDAELLIIRNIVEKFPYVAMDTEFPGVVRHSKFSQLSYKLIQFNLKGCTPRWSLLASGRISIPEPTLQC